MGHVFKELFIAIIKKKRGKRLMKYATIIILIMIYLIFMMLCHIFFKKTILTPEFIFTSCFLPQLAYALFYVKKWNIDLSFDTVLIYVLGVFLFFFYSIFFRQVLFKKIYSLRCNKLESKIINIPNWKLYITILFHLIAIVLMCSALIQATHSSNLPLAIDIYAKVSKGQGMSLPGIPAKMNLLSYLSGFVWMYYLIHSLVYKYKTSRTLIVINLGLSFISNMLTGSRGGVFQIIISGFFLFGLFWGEKYNWKKSISIKTYIKFIIIAVVLIMTFQVSLEWIGRSSTETNLNDYIAKYLSAELKNLDIKITGGSIGFRNITEWSTLNVALSKILSLFGISNTKHYADASTYIEYHGIDLGNVYTIYYPFIIDLSYFGLFFFEGIMSFVCQLSFYRAIHSKFNGYCLDLSKLIYVYILTMLFFSFFSNWFFNNIFSSGFIWCLITWFIFRYFLEISNIKMDFRIHKNI